MKLDIMEKEIVELQSMKSLDKTQFGLSAIKTIRVEDGGTEGYIIEC